MNGNAQDIWLLGSSTALLALLQIVDLALTLLHSLQERKGRLWRYFGAIAGVRISDGFGQVVFFGGLTIALWIVGLFGIAGTVLWQTPLAFGCLGAIIGCRLSDGLFSHVLLDRAGFRPNPGLSSVPLYFVEAAVLIVLFNPALRMHTFPMLTGFVIGVLAFYMVIPGLRTFGRLVFAPVKPWANGGPQPDW